MVLVVLILVIVGVLAAAVLTRATDLSGDREKTVARLNAAAQALEQFAASNARLPCPADPVLDSGAEATPGSAVCNPQDGTIPWRTIGLRFDDAFDPWARKLSYRVYNVNVGSLTQPRGVSMVDCDTVEPAAAGNPNADDADANGLCVASADPYSRTTTPAKFYAGKGLALTDMGTPHGDVAFVVISHGATGLGGYTVSGARLDLPSGGSDERGNTRASGPFTISAFSGLDVAATAPAHFDDLLVYRTLPDLVKRAGLAARDWPEPGTTAAVFDNASIAAAVGHAVPPGDIGQNTIDIGGTRVSGFAGANVATNLSFDTNASGGGFGVAGSGSNLVTDTGGEFIRIDLGQGALSFGVTLNDFGTYTSGTLYTEQVEFRFYSLGTLVGSPIVKAGCRADGGLASFSMSPAAAFNRVEIRALPATSASAATSATGFLLSGIRACATTGTCATALATPLNDCP